MAHFSPFLHFLLLFNAIKLCWIFLPLLFQKKPTPVTLVECLAAIELQAEVIPFQDSALENVEVGLSVLEAVYVAKFELRLIVTSCP